MDFFHPKYTPETLWVVIFICIFKKQQNVCHPVGTQYGKKKEKGRKKGMKYLTFVLIKEMFDAQLCSSTCLGIIMPNLMPNYV